MMQDGCSFAGVKIGQWLGCYMEKSSANQLLWEKNKMKPKKVKNAAKKKEKKEQKKWLGLFMVRVPKPKEIRFEYLIILVRFFWLPNNTNIVNLSFYLKSVEWSSEGEETHWLKCALWLCRCAWLRAR